MREHKYWDVGEQIHGKPPNLGKTSTAKVMQALITLRGYLHDSCFDGTDDMLDHFRYGVYRISLPVGKKNDFERITGYKLTSPPEVRA